MEQSRMTNHNEAPQEEPIKKSSISKIIGLNPEQEKQKVEVFDQLFNGHIQNHAEREKTEEENRAIQQVLDELPDFIKRYEGNPVLHVTLDHIHILERDKLNDNVKSFFDNQGGGYSTVDQYLYIVD